MTLTRNPSRPWATRVAMLAVAAALAACGSDDDSSASVAPTLSGIAATGAPIVGGTVDVRCAGGSALSTTTGADGAWQLTTSGQTLPCAVRVSGGTVGGSASRASYHALAFDFDINLNLTPLSDLALARALAADPQAWFTAPAFTGLTATRLQTALGAVVDALGVRSTLGTIDPLTAVFQPQAGDTIDDLLEALHAARAMLSIDESALRAAAASGDFAAVAGLPAAIADALAGGGSGGTGCTAGTEMIYDMSAPGGPYADNETICVAFSGSTLTVDGRTLANGVKNDTVVAPFAAWSFEDGSNTWEVVLKNGALYEINYLAANFLGQFTPVTAAGTGSLSVEIKINGTVASTVAVPNAEVPTSQDDFCTGVTSDETFNAIQAQSGVTLTITGCSFANNTGVIDATASAGGVSVPYVVTFRYTP